MYCHYVTININTNHTCIDEEHKTCVILVLVKKDDDTKTITDCSNCVVNKKILTLTRKKTILFVDRVYGSTKHKGYYFQCKPVTLIWISFGKFAWPLQVASQASRLYIRKHNAWSRATSIDTQNCFSFRVRSEVIPEFLLLHQIESGRILRWIFTRELLLLRGSRN